MSGSFFELIQKSTLSFFFFFLGIGLLITRTRQAFSNGTIVLELKPLKVRHTHLTSTTLVETCLWTKTQNTNNLFPLCN